MSLEKDVNRCSKKKKKSTNRKQMKNIFGATIHMCNSQILSKFKASLSNLAWLCKLIEDQSMESKKDRGEGRENGGERQTQPNKHIWESDTTHGGRWCKNEQNSTAEGIINSNMLPVHREWGIPFFLAQQPTHSYTAPRHSHKVFLLQQWTALFAVSGTGRHPSVCYYKNKPASWNTYYWTLWH